MGKKYLRKSEFRMDLNPLHKNSDGENHPAYISARHGHKYKANTITHAEIIYNETTLKLSKNPNLLSKDKRQSRLGRPEGSDSCRHQLLAQRSALLDYGYWWFLRGESLCEGLQRVLEDWQGESHAGGVARVEYPMVPVWSFLSALP